MLMNSANRSNRYRLALLAAALICLLAGCSYRETAAPQGSPDADTQPPVSAAVSDADAKEEPDMNKTLRLYIGGRELPVTWEESDSVAALARLAGDGLDIPMSMYGGFEQVGSLGASLPRGDSRITTQYGDIVLYSGNQIVIFYGSNTWEYTRLGHIDLTQSELEALLSQGDVRLTITCE